MISDAPVEAIVIHAGSREPAIEGLALLSLNNRRTALDLYRVSSCSACHNSYGHNHRHNYPIMGQRKGIVRHMAGVSLTLLQLIG